MGRCSHSGCSGSGSRHGARFGSTVGVGHDLLVFGGLRFWLGSCSDGWDDFGGTTGDIEVGEGDKPWGVDVRSCLGVPGSESWAILIGMGVPKLSELVPNEGLRLQLDTSIFER